MFDGPLTTRDVGAVHNPGGEIVYLASCQTAMGGLRLLNEAMHMAGAMQAAGFKHVIAGLWAVPETVAVRLATAFYRQLLKEGSIDAGNAAYALHKALRGFRAELPAYPRLWASFVHFGP